MPLPLIPVLFVGTALATAAFGAKKGYDAYEDTKTADYWHNRAKEMYSETESDLNEARKATQDTFEKLGQLQADIVENELIKYAELIDKLDVKSNVELADIVGKETNATLAWFGGGSLAAGGLGMAGGTLVLGGIVAAPVIAVAASVFAASAEKKKYDAKAYYNSVKALCEAMEGEALTYKEMLAKSSEKIEILETNKQEMQELIEKVESIMRSKDIGTFWGKIRKFFYKIGIIKQDSTAVRNWSETEQTTLKTLMQLAEVVVITINAPIMNDEVPLTKRLREHQDQCQKLMAEIENKWG